MYSCRGRSRVNGEPGSMADGQIEAKKILTSVNTPLPWLTIGLNSSRSSSSPAQRVTVVSISRRPDLVLLVLSPQRHPTIRHTGTTCTPMLSIGGLSPSYYPLLKHTATQVTTPTLLIKGPNSIPHPLPAYHR